MRFEFRTLLILLIASCQSTSWMAEGDAAFSIGDYGAAVSAYRQAQIAGEGELDPSLSTRLAEAQARILPAHARRLIHQEKHLEALEVLEAADQASPGHTMTVELRARAYRGMASDLVDEAEALRGMGEVKAAYAAFLQALEWHPENSRAEAGCGELAEKIATLQRQGESFFFDGLRQRAEGHTVRAHTSFMHAAAIWGEGSQAEAILRESSAEMAKEQVQMATLLMEADSLGPAWLALRDANRLQPGNSETESLLSKVEVRLKTRASLNDVDIQIRGERMALASSILLHVAETDLAEEADRVYVLRQAMVEKQALIDYRMARAFELAEQWERAAELYGRVLESGQGAEDVRWRLERVQSRLSADTE
ncbi:MAG TPA: hypothetical protein QGG59_10800 [Planctomycetota bacterium]|jgi:tetratricopeptide (TPR) repeat protein|nr:hypothetical protein [Planctomycetota bacterium]MDP7245078.1 hypothetical protein [Planctomycetota bacterium]HJM40585.1 hypothetical protein [Planctomycetota bacterium]